MYPIGCLYPSHRKQVLIMDELLPCPFCGGKAYLEPNHRAFVDGKTTRVAFVRCVKCNARSGRAKLSDYGRTSHSGCAENDVIAAWNKRFKEGD